MYAVHESIGHPGIFVSGSVSLKEHREFACNIDMVDMLPPGLYQAEIADKTPETINADLANGNYIMSFARRKLSDVHAIVDYNEEDEQSFAAVARISDINLGLYRSFLQSFVRAGITPEAAQWMQSVHPLRFPYETISDRTTWIAPLKKTAQQVRENRQAIAPDNQFLLAQTMMSNAISSGLTF